MPLVFAHDTLGQRMLFGTGLAAQNVAAEIERLGAKRVMTISSSSGSAALGDLPVALAWHDVVQHVPIETAKAARAAATDGGIDLMVSVGGGSTTGLAKAIALTTGIPIIAVPTTYSGSEATNVWGLTENARKSTRVDARVLPVTVVYDAALTLSLPVALSVASGLNGIAHCIDSLWAPRADPMNAALATEGIRALAGGLRLIHADAADVEGRERALYGAYLAAVAFASAGSGMHHKICHVLGGTYTLPHAETHATVLPYVTAFTVPFAPDAERRIAQAFDSPSALEGLNSLRFELGAPTALRDYGFAAADVAEAASLALPAIPASHPRPVSQADLERLLSAALDGVTPTSELFTTGGAV